MGNSTMLRTPSNHKQPDTAELLQAILGELRALRASHAALVEMLDEFADVYLNAKFKYGKPTDRWGHRYRG